MLELIHSSRMKPSLLALVALLCIGLLQSCASPSSGRSADDAWPDALPDREIFERGWRQDSTNRAIQSEEEYLLWVRRFYEGFSMNGGWLEMTSEIHSRVDAATVARAAPLLAGLGMRIGREWAKDNEVRRIDTHMVAVWRTALMEAIWQDDLVPFLARLEDDIGGLLAGTLAPERIELHRYYLIDEVDFE